MLKFFRKTLLRKGNTTNHNHLFYTFGENLLAVAGIPEEIKDKIFQPFFTTKPTGQGTGLGLSLSYDIVKAHGGEIRVKSREGSDLPAGEAGTEFTIELPI